MGAEPLVNLPYKADFQQMKVKGKTKLRINYTEKKY